MARDAVQKISWEFAKPAYFPCMVCNERDGKHQHKITVNNDLEVYPLLCDECVKLSDEEILNALTAHYNEIIKRQRR